MSKSAKRTGRCQHCRRRLKIQARQLCQTCYRTPDIREQYSSPPEGPRKKPAEPTTAIPGTPEKMAVMAERARGARGSLSWLQSFNPLHRDIHIRREDVSISLNELQSFNPLHRDIHICPSGVAPIFSKLQSFNPLHRDIHEIDTADTSTFNQLQSFNPLHRDIHRSRPNPRERRHFERRSRAVTIH